MVSNGRCMFNIIGQSHNGTLLIFCEVEKVSINAVVSWSTNLAYISQV